MNIINTFIVLISFINLFLGYLILTKDYKEKQNIYLSFFIFSLTGWGVSIGAMAITHDIIWPRLAFLFVSGAFILFILFLTEYLKSVLTLNRTVLSTFLIFGVIVWVLSLTPFIIADVKTLPHSAGFFEGVALDYGSLFYFVIVYYLASFFYILFLMVAGHRNAPKKTKIQMRYFFVGTMLFAFFGLITNLILPAFNIFTFNGVGPLFSTVLVAFISYAILKHGFLNVKVIGTELFIFFIWFFILIRTIISDTPQDQVINGSLLLLTIVAGIFLIRSVKIEVRQREEIEKLAKDLQIANTRLNKISMLKTEFVSLATHQLRSPLTAIKGYVSMILEGSYGPVNEQMKEPLKRVFNSTGTLTQVVQDFLDVSRIEQGSMKYDMKALSFKDLTEEVINEQSPNAKNIDIAFSFDFEKDDESGARYLVYGDRSKLKQVVSNLIDNALKYTKRGFVKVRLSYTSNTVVLEVTDSGMGIDEKTLSALFQKFERADGADEVNVQGTGLGLYIAKQIIEAHGGTIRASSGGHGQGSTFSVELKRKEF
jgi:signal transduction histidine kinase